MEYIKFQCKDCPDRHLGCHASCDKYKKAQESNKEFKKEMKKDRKINEARYDLRSIRYKKKSSNNIQLN